MIRFSASGGADKSDADSMRSFDIDFLRLRRVTRVARVFCAWFALAVPLCLPVTAQTREARSLIEARPLVVPASGRTGFTRMPALQTRVTFTNVLSDSLAGGNRILENGSGVALGDVDGDGLCDIYLCRLEGPNVLYRNLGNWRFEASAAGSGIACENQFSTGAVLSDIDGDRDLDLLVTSIGGGARSFRNDGKGRFAEDTHSGLIGKGGSTSMALADIDGDGDLDLYVANYRTNTIRNGSSTNIQVIEIDGRMIAQPADRFEIVTAPNGNPVIYEKGEPDHLYLNDGIGHFELQSWMDGRFRTADGQPFSEPPRHWGLAVAMRDFSGDGVPDIYVCNDFIDSPDDIWINDGTGRFRAVEPFALRTTSWSSMAIDFSDIDRDGLVDFFVVDMLSRSHRLRQTQRANADMANVAIEIGEIDNRPQTMRNTLFLNRGDGTFAEIAQLSGLQASDWSWSPVFLDVDLDGFEDLLITNGNGHDVQDADTSIRNMEQNRGVPKDQWPNSLLIFPRLETRNMAFRNRGDLTFEEMSAAWGFDLFGISHGMAAADLDNDGDLDLVVNNLNQSAALYRNESSAPRIAVRLKGLGGNAHGVGSTITVSGGPVRQSHDVISGNRYLSGDDSMRVFAAGSKANELTVRVEWRSGVVTEMSGISANHFYEIQEPGHRSFGGAALPRRPDISAAQQHSPTKKKDTADNQRISNSFFEDVSSRLRHKHHEHPFADFTVQPLLPHRFSQLGPGIAWHDLDGDEFEDLIIGSGRGGEIAILKNDRSGGFRLVPGAREALAIEDQTSVAGLSQPNGKRSVMVGFSSYEAGGKQQPAIITYGIKSGKVSETGAFPGQTSSVGPMALADVDRDGDLDLFVGGRLNPARYPEPATSRLFLGDKGRFRLDRKLSLPFVDLALVSGAVFSDLDLDGDADLVLACDWSPLRVFRNDPSGFVEVTRSLGFYAFKGRWNGVTTGDFDNDGRLDIVASNWGRNTKFQRFLEKPLHLYYGDFDRNGTIEIVEAYTDPELQELMPWRGFVTISRAMPFLNRFIPSFEAYGKATAANLFQNFADTVSELTVNTLDATVFLNRGDHFEGHALPIEAQFAPSFGVNTGDFDGDGNEDVFLSQNFFAVYNEDSRQDAGRGLWLRGDGRGGFVSVPASVSGISVFGEQRGSALCDFDHDGRIDLAVSQNGAATKLYRNIGGKPGLRVRLRGSEENPDGIGAMLRVVYGDHSGPIREIHAGSGYWSQDSSTQVMGLSSQPKAIWVRWADGATDEKPIPTGQMNLILERNNK